VTDTLACDVLPVLKKSVLADYDTFLVTEAALAGISVRVEDDFTEILNEGVARLKKLGFDPVAKMVRGQPVDEIGKFAKEIDAPHHGTSADTSCATSVSLYCCQNSVDNWWIFGAGGPCDWRPGKNRSSIATWARHRIECRNLTHRRQRHNRALHVMFCRRTSKRRLGISMINNSIG
jgi:hypothetical protein